jgi:hypothetical protein
MIPRRRLAPPTPAPEHATDAPPIRHTATDYEFVLTTHVEPFSIIDGDGSIEDAGDRYVLIDAAGRREIFKAHLQVLRQFEREWHTAAPIYQPEPSDVSST